MLKCCADAIAFCCGLMVKSFHLFFQMHDLEVKTGQPKAKKTPGGWTSADAWDKYVQPKVVNYDPVDAEKDYTAVDMRGFAKKKASACDW